MTTLIATLIAATQPLSLHDIELLELESIEILTRQDTSQHERAKQILRMAAEIRKARGVWDEKTLTQEEIDREIAMLRGAS